MLKIFVLFMCVVFASTYDVCRRKVHLSSTDTCGPVQTMFNEGKCLCCYYDTKGIPTIGVGFNLQRGDAAQAMLKYNLTLSNVLQDCAGKTTNHCLTEENADDLFSLTYPEFESCADAFVPNLPATKRAAIVDVAFAGCATLNKFVKMRKALEEEDWNEAAAQLRDSLWCSQVGENRCNSNYNCIKGCAPHVCGPDVQEWPQCSSGCFCLKTLKGAGFCAPNFHCKDLPDCSNCSSKTSVCLVEQCCGTPRCVPKTSSCPNNRVFKTFNSNLSVFSKRCQSNKDCKMGTFCERTLSGGSYCV